MGNDIGPYDFGQVYVMRCLNGLARLPDNCIDMIIAECPTGDDTFFKPCARVLKPAGAFYVRSEGTDEWNEKWTERLKAAGFMVIHKVETTDFNPTRGFDCFLIGTKGEHQFRTEPPPLEFIHPKVPEDEKMNKAQRDVETYVDLIQLSTDERGIILDICAGSAASGVACIQTGRQYLGFENCSITTGKANQRLRALK